MKINYPDASTDTSEHLNPSDLVRVRWFDRHTRKFGAGELCTRAEAESVLRQIEPKYPHITHWIVEE